MTLIHGDTLVLDRWFWLKSRLPKANNGERLIDIGCGTGAFSIGAESKGYKVLGLSWDNCNQAIAQERARICGAENVDFEVQDIRYLDTRNDLYDRFELAFCMETIEHILDDGKLFRDINKCLKPGGRLLLSTPYLNKYPIGSEDDEPLSDYEDGRHVRRGYSSSRLVELCDQSGFLPLKISFCSGFMSQKITSVMRATSRFNPLLAWGIILPLRLLPLVLDSWISPVLDWPFYSICLEAVKQG